MFKRYQDICDVVSLLVCCHPDRTYLLTKEANGEFWLPSSKVEKDCWKLSAHKINFEIFGMDAASTCTPIRVYKVWLPKHTQPYVYHVIYKVAIKIEVKRRIKMKAGLRNRLQWFSSVELERQRAHATLRSPELALFAQMATAEHKDSDIQSVVSDLEPGYLIEICEENLLICNDSETGAGAVTQSSANHQLLQAAGYSKDDQLRIYREFMVMVYPALYMSPNFFTQFMMDIGFQRQQCPSLFRAADVNGRGGLSYQELLLWAAALEPVTQHSGIPAEIRCRYIFRYFDSNRDMKLEYVEFKELVAAARLARQLPVDALSVARDADVCLRQLGMQPNAQLPLAEFLRGVGELHLRGTSSLLRASRSISGYLIDLQGKGSETNKSDIICATTSSKLPRASGTGATTGASSGANSAARSTAVNFEYSMAIHTVKLRQKSPHEMLVLNNFDDEAVSPSTARLMAAATTSIDVLGPASAPVEAIAAVHYFAAAIDKPGRRNSVSVNGKAAWSWLVATEEAALGSLLLKLADAACVLVSNEPRLLRLSSPVYAVGDLHGNLPALLSMEAVLWPSGTALAPARLLFLGDYVDRGAYGTELMAYLLAAKLQRPHAILLIRGNHETRDIQKMFTFYNECITKYGDIEGNKIWNAINNVFDALPLAAVVDDKVFCCHGGIPPPWVCPLISAIDKVPVPLTRPAEQSSIAWELLWNDPVKLNKMTATLALELAANDGFAANTKRGTGHVFDQTALDRFLLANQLSHVVRAHELHQNGFMCQLRGRLISVFSSYHYCGGTNDSGVALLEGGKLRLIRVGVD